MKRVERRAEGRDEVLVNRKRKVQERSRGGRRRKEGKSLKERGEIGEKDREVVIMYYGIGEGREEAPSSRGS